MLVTEVVPIEQVEVTVVPVKLVIGYVATAGAQVVEIVGDMTIVGGWLNCTFSPVVDRSIIQSDGCIKTGISARVIGLA